jgi:hypothetical protein
MKTIPARYINAPNVVHRHLIPVTVKRYYTARRYGEYMVRRSLIHYDIDVVLEV